MVYRTQGVCSREIHYDIVEEDGKRVVRNVSYVGGCHGNLQGISKLVEGMEVTEVIEKLKGIRCGYKDTSCPDQLARALEKEI